jgi:hypothetical protein
MSFRESNIGKLLETDVDLRLKRVCFVLTVDAKIIRKTNVETLFTLKVISLL